MRIIYSLIILVFLTSIVWGCNDSNVTVNIVSHNKVTKPIQTREVELKITNKTGCSIFVKGDQVSSFFPLTLYLRRYSNKKKFESHLYGSKIPKFEEVSSWAMDDVEVKNGDSLTFASLTGDSDHSVKLKIVVYVSIGDRKSPPKSVVSRVFSFDGRLD